MNPSPAPLPFPPFHDAILRGLASLEQVVVGKSAQLKRAMATLLAEGHLLLEDLPGSGKTTLAKALASLLGGGFQRVQGTNDLLPSDLLGVHLWDAELRQFRFQPGPVFTNVLLIDELNRIGPKTQSALLEVMTEGQVSLDRSTLPLPRPFFVIATQNPQDHAGTFPLPESQLDRFMCSMHLGFPAASEERRVLRGAAGAQHLSMLEPILPMEAWLQVQEQVRSVLLGDRLLDYAQRLIAQIRSQGGFCSTRGALQWLSLSKATAWIEGRNYVTPDDLQATLADAMAHRGHLDERRLNRTERRDQLAATIQTVPVGWQP